MPRSSMARRFTTSAGSATRAGALASAISTAFGALAHVALAQSPTAATVPAAPRAPQDPAPGAPAAPLGSPPAPPARSRLQLGLSTGLTWGLGEIWEGEGDVSSSAGNPVFFDLAIAPSYRIAPHVALGMRAGVGLEPGSRAEASTPGGSVSLERRQWHIGALARYQPQPARGWFATLGAGAAAMVDTRGTASESRWAPLLEASAGYAWSLARPLSVGFELRAAYADFGDGSHTSPAGYYDYRVSTWLGCGVVVEVLP